ncbi:hypothetical protein HNQ96_004999 [Aminobacter lissarensis]|uniref:Uncharacterized protein n=1 Tax=Aminobacter carboxidus TaxID=376165 RepID=A0A8E1WHM3_9HYPH|nr:hypothetical protein [Aminobacter lissarensis]MBB6469110.1 hypothetical protein [Aminobacter lissarensis]
MWRAESPERNRGEWRLRDAEMGAVPDYFSVEDEWLALLGFRFGDGEHAETGSQSWFLQEIFG